MGRKVNLASTSGPLNSVSSSADHILIIEYKYSFYLIPSCSCRTDVVKLLS